jgi:hypothetical protein
MGQQHGGAFSFFFSTVTVVVFTRSSSFSFFVRWQIVRVGVSRRRTPNAEAAVAKNTVEEGEQAEHGAPEKRRWSSGGGSGRCRRCRQWKAEGNTHFFLFFCLAAAMAMFNCWMTLKNYTFEMRQ